MFQYHCLNPIAEKGLGLFNEEYKKSEDLQECDAVLVRSAKMHDMELPKSVCAVARAGAGVNNIPVKEYAEKGVVVFNTPGANANGVKELVLAGMLLASRDIVGGIEWVAQEKDKEHIGKLAEKQKKQFAGCEISGKKLGIIGLGAIGAMVANAACGLGMEVYGYDPYLSIDAAWNLSRTIKHSKSLDEIYSQCDYITIHVPLTDNTRKMIDREAFTKMKDGVVLLNFARDLLVDEEALIEALDSGKVKKYVTDFANPLVAGRQGILVTPHLGASTEESEENCAVMAVKEVRDYVKQWKKNGETVGFVPTMGYLHEGHGSLITAARNNNDRVVVSIFVNPMQFGPTEDLESYPRDLEKDSKYCESLGADLIFHPEPSEMYHDDFSTYVDMSVLTEELCGLSRPVHFRGVCTVVNKLFNIVQPDRAYFGEKDAQQLAIIKHMVQDLNMDIEVIGCPIVREEDGLAKSSRNTYLSPEERKAALILSQTVELCKKLIADGETDADVVVSKMKENIEKEPLAKIDYVKAVNGLTMQQQKEIKAPMLIAMAVYIGKTRLIDNYILG